MNHITLFCKQENETAAFNADSPNLLVSIFENEDGMGISISFDGASIYAELNEKTLATDIYNALFTRKYLEVDSLYADPASPIDTGEVVEDEEAEDDTWEDRK